MVNWAQASFALSAFSSYSQYQAESASAELGRTQDQIQFAESERQAQKETRKALATARAYYGAMGGGAGPLGSASSRAVVSLKDYVNNLEVSEELSLANFKLNKSMIRGNFASGLAGAATQYGLDIDAEKKRKQRNEALNQHIYSGAFLNFGGG